MTLHETRRLRSSVAEIERQFRDEGPGGVYRDGTADNDLHIQIVRGSRNRWLTDIICNELYPLLRIYRIQSTMATASLKQRAKAVSREHDAIISAIEQRDPDAAERCMRMHLVASRENLMKWLRQRQSIKPRESRRSGT